MFTYIMMGVRQAARLELTLGTLAAVLWGVTAIGCTIVATGSSQIYGSGVQ